MNDSATDMLLYEKAFLEKGHSLIAGVDEAGRGAWAGPVIAAAVILPLDHEHLLGELEGVRDSKLCTARQRDVSYEVVRSVALAIGVGSASAGEVDRMGVVPASRLAMRRAVEKLSPRPDALLIDGGYMRLRDVGLEQQPLVKGELKSISIAAASIIAKVERDRLMIRLAGQYPDYGFARHKGYGTPQHRRALAELGPCPIHRRSFAPVRRRLMEQTG
ncbi:MAG TPA: ribonuclease HII [Chloroflexi bacterium]|nr:ribonuclease HII [Chloroflexota bacterium]